MVTFSQTQNSSPPLEKFKIQHHLYYNTLLNPDSPFFLKIHLHSSNPTQHLPPRAPREKSPPAHAKAWIGRVGDVYVRARAILSRRARYRVSAAPSARRVASSV